MNDDIIYYHDWCKKGENLPINTAHNVHWAIREQERPRNVNQSSANQTNTSSVQRDHEIYRKQEYPCHDNKYCHCALENEKGKGREGVSEKGCHFIEEKKGLCTCYTVVKQGRSTCRPPVIFISLAPIVFPSVSAHFFFTYGVNFWGGWGGCKERSCRRERGWELYRRREWKR